MYIVQAPFNPENLLLANPENVPTYYILGSPKEMWTAGKRLAALALTALKMQKTDTASAFRLIESARLEYPVVTQGGTQLFFDILDNADEYTAEFVQSRIDGNGLSNRAIANIEPIDLFITDDGHPFHPGSATRVTHEGYGGLEGPYGFLPTIYPVTDLEEDMDEAAIEALTAHPEIDGFAVQYELKTSEYGTTRILSEREHFTLGVIDELHLMPIISILSDYHPAHYMNGISAE